MGKASRRKLDKRAHGVLNSATKVRPTVSSARELRIRRDPPQEEKISNALVTLLEDEVPEGSPVESYKVALGFIAICWNISLLGTPKERSDAILAVIGPNDGADAVIRRELISQMERLIANKHKRFPHDRRAVVSWDITFDEDTMRITAAAALSPS